MPALTWGQLTDFTNQIEISKVNSKTSVLFKHLNLRSWNHVYTHWE